MKNLLKIIIVLSIATITVLAFNGTINKNNIALVGEIISWSTALTAIVFNLKNQFRKAK